MPFQGKLHLLEQCNYRSVGGRGGLTHMVPQTPTATEKSRRLERGKVLNSFAPLFLAIYNF